MKLVFFSITVKDCFSEKLSKHFLQFPSRKTIEKIRKSGGMLEELSHHEDYPQKFNWLGFHGNFPKL